MLPNLVSAFALGQTLLCAFTFLLIYAVTARVFARLLLFPWVLPAAWGCFAFTVLDFLFAWLFPSLLVIPWGLLLCCDLRCWLCVVFSSLLVSI